MKMPPWFKRTDWVRNALIAGFVLFGLIKLALFTRHHLVIWDEAVYLTMGKFLLNAGSMGYWETLRPPLLPVITAVLQLIGDPIILGEILMGLIAAGGSYMLYRLLSTRIDRGMAAGTALLVLFGPLWFVWSSRILTGVPSAVLVLAACYAYAKKRPVLAGILSASAFLMRFPAGLVVAAIGGTYGVIMLYSWWKAKRPVWNKATKNTFWYGLVTFGIMGAWFFINWLIWNGETAVWWHAAFRPIILGSTNVFVENIWMRDPSLGFYFFRYLLFFPVSLFALGGLLSLRKHKDLIPLALTGILGLGFFTYMVHNEWRFALITIPGILALTALGLDRVRQMEFRGAAIIVIALLTMNIAGAIVADVAYVPTWTEQRPAIMEYYEFLAENPVAGDIIVSDPVAAWYAPNKIISAYYDPYLLERMLVKEHSAVVFAPHHFPCPPDDSACQASVRSSIDRITSNQDLVYRNRFYGQDYYIFSAQEWLPGYPVDELRAQYDLEEEILLSERPYDVMPVSFILEDFPSLDDSDQAIWYEDQYEAVLETFSDVPSTAAVIPTHLRVLTTIRPQIDNELLRFDVAQNGYDHSSLPGRQQLYELRNGKRIIQEELGIDPDVFIPPLYAADQTTADAVEELGFSAYVSTIGDPIQPGIQRLDQTNTLILNWEENTHKSPDAVLADLSRIERYDDYALMSVYYFMYRDGVEELQEIVERVQDEYRIVTASDLASWTADRSRSNISVTASGVTVTAPVTAEGLTLLVRSDKNLTIDSPVPIHIKNIHSEPIDLCIKDACETVLPDHFFLSMSAMVIPPPEGLLENVAE